MDSVVINIPFFNMNSCGYNQERKMKSCQYGCLWQLTLAKFKMNHLIATKPTLRGITTVFYLPSIDNIFKKRSNSLQGCHSYQQNHSLVSSDFLKLNEIRTARWIIPLPGIHEGEILRTFSPQGNARANPREEIFNWVELLLYKTLTQTKTFVVKTFITSFHSSP